MVIISRTKVVVLVMVKLKVCAVRGGILVDVSILSICFYEDGETWCIDI